MQCILQTERMFIMKTISFLNLKGGVGKTTSSINVAKGLANEGYRVLLIDMDQQSNTTGQFLAKDEIRMDMSTLLLNITHENLQESIHQIDDNLFLIPATLKLLAAETELRLRQDIPQQFQLRTIIDAVKKNFDYCIIDCPPILNLITVNIVIATDLILIPIKIDQYAMDGYETTLEQINNIKRNFHLNVKTKVLFTMVNRNNTNRDVIELFNKKLQFQQTIRYQDKPVTKAGFDKTFVVEDKKANVGLDYNLFIEELKKEGV